jgi:hypothetical protein
MGRKLLSANVLNHGKWRLKVNGKRLQIGSLPPAGLPPEEFAGSVVSDEEDCAPLDAIGFEAREAAIDELAAYASAAELVGDGQVIEIAAAAIVATEHRAG